MPVQQSVLEKAHIEGERVLSTTHRQWFPELQKIKLFDFAER